MSREMLDMAVPISVDAASEYYRRNIGSILNSASNSTINSTTNEKEHEMYECCSSSTSSDSEIDDHDQITKISKNKNNKQCVEDSAQKESKPEQSSLDNAKNLHNINSLAINNSSDVHFGNKTFFNGPVTIKHIVVNNDSNETTDHLGTSNEGFVGSLNNIFQKHSDSEYSKPEEINKDVQQNSKQIATRFLTRKKIIFSTIVLLIIFSTITTVLIFIYNNQQGVEEGIEIIPRNEWRPQPVNDTIEDLVLPLSEIIICHTVNSSCDTKEECLETVKSIQDLHVSPGFRFSDIGYNFLIGGDGNVYEGRGWKKQGAHTSSYNRRAFGIAYIGNFVSELPNQKQIDAGFKLFNEGVKVKALTKDYSICGASQLRNTESPGRAFMEKIKKWPHAEKCPVAIDQDGENQ